jgi:hypothetical protein
MMVQNRALAKIEKENAIDLDWQQIVNKIVDEMGTELPDKVIEATELLLAGWPTYKVSRELNVSGQTIKEWLARYPSMAMAVANGRKLLTKWRMSKLEQQFVDAIKKSGEILELDLDDRAVNAKLVGTIAQHARYIIGLYAGQQIDVNVKVSEGEQTFKAKQDALSYIVDELAKQRNSEEPIEATYTVVSANEDTAPRPLLTEEGNPAFGELGVLDTTAAGTLCHICGKRVSNIKMHVGMEHHMKIKDFEIIFMLLPGSVSNFGEVANGD